MPAPTALDADRLLPRFWQGSYPPEGSFLQRSGFGVLTLCAKELQTPQKFSGISLYLCPMEDDQLTEGEALRARMAATRLASEWHKGQRLLITCAAGLNRSGLVSALTIRILLDCTGEDAASQVRRHRKDALFNPSFMGYLGALGRPSEERKPKRRAARKS